MPISTLPILRPALQRAVTKCGGLGAVPPSPPPAFGCFFEQVVALAAAKNTRMAADGTRTLQRTLLQRRHWTHLQGEYEAMVAEETRRQRETAEFEQTTTTYQPTSTVGAAGAPAAPAAMQTSEHDACGCECVECCAAVPAPPPAAAPAVVKSMDDPSLETAAAVGAALAHQTTQGWDAAAWVADDDDSEGSDDSVDGDSEGSDDDDLGFPAHAWELSAEFRRLAAADTLASANSAAEVSAADVAPASTPASTRAPASTHARADDFLIEIDDDTMVVTPAAAAAAHHNPHQSLDTATRGGFFPPASSTFPDCSDLFSALVPDSAPTADAPAAPPAAAAAFARAPGAHRSPPKLKPQKRGPCADTPGADWKRQRTAMLSGLPHPVALGATASPIMVS